MANVIPLDSFCTPMGCSRGDLWSVDMMRRAARHSRKYVCTMWALALWIEVSVALETYRVRLNRIWRSLLRVFDPKISDLIPKLLLNLSSWLYPVTQKRPFVMWFTKQTRLEEQESSVRLLNIIGQLSTVGSWTRTVTAVRVDTSIPQINCSEKG